MWDTLKTSGYILSKHLSIISYMLRNQLQKKRGGQRSKLSSLMVHVNGKDRRLKII